MLLISAIVGFFLYISAVFSRVAEGRTFGLSFVILTYLIFYSIGPIIKYPVSDWLVPVSFQILGVVVFLVSFCFCVKKVKFGAEAEFFWGGRAYFRLLYWVAVLAFCAVFILYGYSIFMMSRSERMIASENAPFLVLFKLVSFSAYCFYLISYRYESLKKNLVPLCVLLALGVVFSVLTVSRGTLVLYIFPLLFFLSEDKRVSPFRVAMLCTVGVFFASLWKGGVSGLLTGTFNLNPSDVGYPAEFTIWLDVFRDTRGMSQTLMGGSYLDLLKSMVNPFADATPLSVWYVESYHPEIAEVGGGRAFSFLAEVNMNFGLMAVPVIYGAMGVACGLLSRASTVNQYSLYVLCSLLPFMHKMFRSEILAMLKVWWWVCVIPVLLLFVVHKLFFRYR